jgi:ABC-type nitrate/sulfonate/bicarbonate transport system substrate-binding protein
MSKTSRRNALSGLAFACVLAFGTLANTVHAQPVNIRLGHGSAAEEPLWLMMAKPEMFKNNGKVYTLEATVFPASDKRAQAFEAGALDISSWSANAVLSAAAEGVKMKLLASISKESPKAFSTTFYALADSSIKTVKDMKGKTVAVNGFGTSGHLWVKAALERNGMTEDDIKLVPIRFPAMGESLAAGKIDVGMFPQPFAAMAEKQLKVHKVFTAKDAVPFEEELMLIAAKEEYLKKNEAVVRAFLSDLQEATRFYAEKPREARQMLIDAKFVRFSPEIYLELQDYLHDVSLAVDSEALEKMQDQQIKAGFQKKRADVKSLVDNSFIPKN